jgi:hypothetical protein
MYNNYQNPGAPMVVQGHVVDHGSGSESDAATDYSAYKGQGLSLNLPTEIRSAFVRKVYSILSVMLVVTTAVAFPFQLLGPCPVTLHQTVPADGTTGQVQLYDKTTFCYGGTMVMNSTFLMILMYGSLITTIAITCCCLQLLRTFPTNYIMLAIFSVLYGVMVGCICMQYTGKSVILAAAMTTGIFFVCTGYACFTKTDFTGMGGYLMCALIGLLVCGFIMFFVSFLFPGLYPFLHMMFAGFGAVLFSLYIVYDTQLIVGGRHKKHQFSVDDYAFAALNLYLDIINLFLMILSLLGDRK